MVKIKILDHMRLSFERRVVAPLDYASATFRVEHTPLNYLPAPDWREYRAEVKVFFAQAGPAGQEAQMRHTAQRAIASHAFGEVEQEVRAALREMWEVGQHRSKAAQRLDAMLPVLRGEQNRDGT